MNVTDFTPLPALGGGLLIGLAAVAVLWLNGRIAGISGVVSRLLSRPPGDTAWRAAFLAGMVAGGALTFYLHPAAAAHAPQAGWAGILAAGFLVGLGTRLAGDCTSGHGVCGVGRGSARSIGATLLFMAAGFVTVFIVRHALAGGAA